MTPSLSRNSMRGSWHGWGKESTVKKSNYRQRISSPMAVWNEDAEGLHASAAAQIYPLKQEESPLQTGFDGYLSDASDEMRFLHPQVPRQPPMEGSSRKYLHRNVMVTPEQPEPSTLPTIENSTMSKPSSRSSFSVLSRRLSLGTNMPIFARARSETNTMARKSGTFFAATNKDTGHGAWQKNAKSRISWLGTIKMRIKGGRHTGNMSDDVADTEPIAQEYLRDEEDPHEDVYQDAAALAPEKDLSMPRYPRLRSQPSLCKTARRVSNADDVSFVPDTDNLGGKRPQANTPSPFQRQSARKSPFLLPDSNSSARFSSYSSLKEHNHTTQ
ncbi:hypothetical protein IWW45_000272 [Coemansia sp. RSA 485]|nr:hypothetical protein IWW45_000272 [Coemansia sp. RSA 485]